MKTETGLQSWPSLSRPRPLGFEPVLIRVPVISMGSRHSWRPYPGVPPRRRRRLRREVRAAGYTLMTAMALTALVPWGSRPSGTIVPVRVASLFGSKGADVSASVVPPVVSISIEPVALATVAEARLPVVFPGYLLPDDDFDEVSDHAGH